MQADVWTSILFVWEQKIVENVSYEFLKTAGLVLMR